jgi:hypothetical protein
LRPFVIHRHRYRHIAECPCQVDHRRVPGILDRHTIAAAEDYDLPIWAGAIPLSTLVGAAEPDPRLADGIDIPEWVRRFVVGR